MGSVAPAPNSEAPQSSDPPAQGISADEVALYDRQIRLWGTGAQEKIRNSKICLLNLTALACEVAKNLVLAGVGSITLVDHKVVVPRDLGSQFFFSEADIGLNKAVQAQPHVSRLNPRVRVYVDSTQITHLGSAFYENFDIIIACDLYPEDLILINTAARLHGKRFYAAGTEGSFGYIFSDLIQHDYIIEREMSNRPTVLGPETQTRSIIDVKMKKENGKNIEIVKKREKYSTWLLASDVALLPAEYTKSPRRMKAVTPLLPCLRALWEYYTIHGTPLLTNNPENLKEFVATTHKKHAALGLPMDSLRGEYIRTFLQNIGSDIAPVAAVLGGQLAQDVINVLGEQQQPIQNFVFFDGESNECPTYPLHPAEEIGSLGEGLLPYSVGAIPENVVSAATGELRSIPQSTVQ